MTTAHLEKKILQEAKGLPKNSLMQVIDFIQFLREKNKKRVSDETKDELTESSNSQNQHLEEEISSELTQHAMRLSESSLAEDWNEESDEHWESFL